MSRYRDFSCNVVKSLRCPRGQVYSSTGDPVVCAGSIVPPAACSSEGSHSGDTGQRQRKRDLSGHQTGCDHRHWRYVCVKLDVCCEADGGQ
jgi:hypothetical protein